MAVASLDHLVGAGEQCWGHVDAKRLGGLEVDGQFELGRLQKRQIGCFRALENTGDIDATLIVLIERTGAVAYQAAARRVFAPAVDCRDGMARGERSKSCASVGEQRVI